MNLHPHAPGNKVVGRDTNVKTSRDLQNKRRNDNQGKKYGLNKRLQTQARLPILMWNVFKKVQKVLFTSGCDPKKERCLFMNGDFRNTSYEYYGDKCGYNKH